MLDLGLVLLNILSFVFSDFNKTQKNLIIYQFCRQVTWILAATWHYNVIILLVYITLESSVPQTIWSSNLHQRHSLTKDPDWWRHHFGHVTHVHFTDWKSFVHISAKVEKWCHQLTYSLVLNRLPPLLNNFSKFFTPGHSYSKPNGYKFWEKFHPTQAFKIHTRFVFTKIKKILKIKKVYQILGDFPTPMFFPTTPSLIRFWEFFYPLAIPTPFLLGTKGYFVKGTFLWKFQVDITPRSQEMPWFLFLSMYHGL